MAYKPVWTSSAKHTRCANNLLFCYGYILWFSSSLIDRKRNVPNKKDTRGNMPVLYRLNHDWLWPWSWNFQCCHVLLLLENILVELSVLNKVKTL